MGLVQKASTAATATIPIDLFMNSTGNTRLFPNLHIQKATNNLEITQPSGTNRLLNIFGIPVTIQTDEDAIIITDDIVYMYGVGNTPQEAIEDYKISIKAYFEELQENEDRLGNNLKQHLYYLHNTLMQFE